MKEFFQHLKFVWKYVKNLKPNLIRYVGCNIVAIVISILVPILSAKIIIHLTSNAWEQLILIAIAIYIIENLRNIVSYFARYHAQIVYRESFTTLQTVLGKEIVKIENACMDANSSGVFI